ncbi:MAG: hypothetical protein HC828_21215 [Blastochloris sp.]|nr:hypothetical protein [Blastochloris sp.]
MLSPDQLQAIRACSRDDQAYAQLIQLIEQMVCPPAAADARLMPIGGLSHRLHTLLNALGGITSLLQETALTIEQHELVGTIASTAQTVQTVIDDMLLFARIGG